jgi:hypothetical protein
MAPLAFFFQFPCLPIASLTKLPTGVDSGGDTDPGPLYLGLVHGGTLAMWVRVVLLLFC